MNIEEHILYSVIHDDHALLSNILEQTQFFFFLSRSAHLLSFSFRSVVVRLDINGVYLSVSQGNKSDCKP